MVLAIAVIVVLVLFAVALLPVKKRDGESRIAFTPAAPASHQPINLRRQQLREESTAIADEYERLAHQAWLQDVRLKATGLLSPPQPAAPTVLDE